MTGRRRSFAVVGNSASCERRPSQWTAVRSEAFREAMRKNVMSDTRKAPHTLMCNEVWGGNRKVVRTVQLASVTAWMASVPLDEGEGGGDLYYMSVCNHGLISRVALADVSGHGHVVSAMTETLQKLMHENIDVWDQADFMRGLNETFALSAQNKYATAIVLSIDRITGRLAFSNAGHLPPLWYHARHKQWGWLKEDDFLQADKASGLPIGLIPGTDYLQTVVNLEPYDRLGFAHDRLIGEIGWKCHVYRTPMVKRLRNQPLRFVRDILRRHDGAGANHGFRHSLEKVVLAISERVVHERARRLHRHVRHTYEVKYRKVFGIGSGDAVDGAQLANAVGCAQGRNALDAGVPVGRIRSVQFVAAANPVHVGMVADRVIDGEGIVSWHSKDVGDPDRLQPRQYVFDDCHFSIS